MFRSSPLRRMVGLPDPVRATDPPRRAERRAQSGRVFSSSKLSDRQRSPFADPSSTRVTTRKRGPRELRIVSKRCEADGRTRTSRVESSSQNIQIGAMSAERHTSKPSRDVSSTAPGIPTRTSIVVDPSAPPGFSTAIATARRELSGESAMESSLAGRNLVQDDSIAVTTSGRIASLLISLFVSLVVAGSQVPTQRNHRQVMSVLVKRSYRPNLAVVDKSFNSAGECLRSKERYSNSPHCSTEVEVAESLKGVVVGIELLIFEMCLETDHASDEPSLKRYRAGANGKVERSA